MGRKLLAFDVGNSRMKVALYDGDCLIVRESFAKREWGDCERIMGSRFAPHGTPDGCLIASVVQGVDESIQDAVKAVWDIAPRVVDTTLDLGIGFAVPRPDRVGIDRLLEASEAFHIVQGAVVVAAFGSAITVDLVTAEGVFCGGIIAPGLRLGLKALHDETSLLPKVDLQPPDSAIGANTIACMQAGVVYGAAGAVERLFSEFASDRNATLVLTGGDAELMAAYVKTPHQLEADLVIRALVSLDRRLRNTN